MGGVAVLENLDIVNCGGNAIFADEQSRVRNCRVGATNGSGIVVGDSSLVESSISISQRAPRFSARAASTSKCWIAIKPAR